MVSFVIFLFCLLGNRKVLPETSACYLSASISLLIFYLRVTFGKGSFGVIWGSSLPVWFFFLLGENFLAGVPLRKEWPNERGGSKKN